MHFWFFIQRFALGDGMHTCSRDADNSLARRGRKQASVSVRMAWISLGALSCKQKKNLMTARVSMCWNHARLRHGSKFVSFLVGLRMWTEIAEESATSIVREKWYTRSDLSEEPERHQVLLELRDVSSKLQGFVSLKPKPWEPQISPSALSFVTNLQALTCRDKTKQRTQIPRPFGNMWHARAFFCSPRVQTTLIASS